MKNDTKGQTLTEYALLVAAAGAGLILVNKTLFGAIGAVLRRILSVVSLPVP